MTTPTKPTALPERLEAKRVGGINAAYIYHDGDVIDGPMHPLFAIELVRRYNAHDELVRACEAALGAITDMWGANCGGKNGAVRDQLRSALDKARGKE